MNNINEELGRHIVLGNLIVILIINWFSDTKSFLCSIWNLH